MDFGVANPGNSIGSGFSEGSDPDLFRTLHPHPEMRKQIKFHYLAMKGKTNPPTGMFGHNENGYGLLIRSFLSEYCSERFGFGSGFSLNTLIQK